MWFNFILHYPNNYFRLSGKNKLHWLWERLSSRDHLISRLEAAPTGRFYGNLGFPDMTSCASGKWSTWSPGRFPIPEADEEFEPAFQKALGPYSMWPKIEGGHYHFLIDAKVRTTCAHCQFICCPDKTERKKRYKMLTQSGVVVQRSNGKLEAVSPEEAIEILSNMPEERRRLYEDIA
jgi:hypothetical protein